jgi:hypothetical protein
MPNWVFTSVEIEGPAAEVDRFYSGLKKSDNKEDFEILNSYYPTPDELMTRTAGTYSENYPPKWDEFLASGIMSQEQYDESIRLNTEGYELDKQCIATYGYPNWLHWQRDKWGTKWGDVRTYIEEPSLEADGETKITTGRFETAWAPATEGFKEISRLFPSLRFEFYYAEEADFLAGAEVIKGGEVLFQSFYQPMDEFGDAPEGIDYDSKEMADWLEDYDNFRMQSQIEIEIEARKYGR